MSKPHRSTATPRPTPLRTPAAPTISPRAPVDEAARERDIHARAVNAEIAGMYLDGLASLLEAWPYYLTECVPSHTTSERLGMFTGWALREIVDTMLMPPSGCVNK